MPLRRTLGFPTLQNNPLLQPQTFSARRAWSTPISQKSQSSTALAASFNLLNGDSGGIKAGDILFVGFTVKSTTASVSDNLNGTWLPISSGPAGGNAGWFSYLFAFKGSVAAIKNAMTVTVTGFSANTDYSAVFGSASGGDGTLDVSGFGANINAGPSPVTLTPSVGFSPGELMIYVAGNQQAGGYGAGTNCTVLAQNKNASDAAVVLAYNISAPTVATAYSVAQGNSVHNWGLAALFALGTPVPGIAPPFIVPLIRRLISSRNYWRRTPQRYDQPVASQLTPVIPPFVVESRRQLGAGLRSVAPRKAKIYDQPVAPQSGPITPPFIPETRRLRIALRTIRLLRRANRSEVIQTLDTLVERRLRALRAIAPIKRRTRSEVTPPQLNPPFLVESRRPLLAALRSIAPRRKRPGEPPWPNFSVIIPDMVNWTARTTRRQREYVRRARAFEIPWGQATTPLAPLVLQTARLRRAITFRIRRLAPPVAFPDSRVSETARKPRPVLKPRRSLRFEPPWAQVSVIIPVTVEWWRSRRPVRAWTRRAKSAEPPWSQAAAVIVSFAVWPPRLRRATAWVRRRQRSDLPLAQAAAPAPTFIAPPMRRRSTATGWLRRRPSALTVDQIPVVDTRRRRAVVTPARRSRASLPPWAQIAAPLVSFVNWQRRRTQPLIWRPRRSRSFQYFSVIILPLGNVFEYVIAQVRDGATFARVRDGRSIARVRDGATFARIRVGAVIARVRDGFSRLIVR